MSAARTFAFVTILLASAPGLATSLEPRAFPQVSLLGAEPEIHHPALLTPSTSRTKTVAFGALGTIAGDVGALLVGLAAYQVTCHQVCSEITTGVQFKVDTSTVVFLAADVVLVPLGAAFGESFVARGSEAKSFLFGLIANVVVTAAAISMGTLWLARHPYFDWQVIPAGVLVGALHFVGVPWAASFGFDPPQAAPSAPDLAIGAPEGPRVFSLPLAAIGF